MSLTIFPCESSEIHTGVVVQLMMATMLFVGLAVLFVMYNCTYLVCRSIFDVESKVNFKYYWGH
jgi:hypothetical protein